MPCGKLGLALLQHSSDDSNKIILYKTKDAILSALQLGENVIIYWKSPYLQYRDELNAFWSLHFDTANGAEEIFAILKGKCTIDGYSSEPAVEKSKISENIVTESSALSTQETVESIVSSQTEPINSKSIVIRMAKIGHQLPILSNNNQSTDKEDAEIETIDASTTEKEKNLLVAMPSTSDSMRTQSFKPSSIDLNSFVNEHRLQNTEVRMNLSKLDSKLDRVLDKIDLLQLGGEKLSAGDFNKDQEIITLEEKVLTLKKSNHMLKLQLQEAERVRKDALDKISTQNSNAEALANLKKEYDEKDSQIADLRRKSDELNKNLEDQKQSFDEKVAESNQTISDQLAEIEKLKAAVQEKEDYIQMLKELKPKESTSNNAETIRAIMNQFYTQFFEAINERDALTSSEVLKLTAELIRKETKAALNQK